MELGEGKRKKLSHKERKQRAYGIEAMVKDKSDCKSHRGKQQQQQLEKRKKI